MSDAAPVIAFFRSCARPSFRAEVIKSLRGLAGEHTHTTYRSMWLTDEVVEHFKANRDFTAISILVDPLSELAFPSRMMRPVVAPHFSSGSWHFTFELGAFVSVHRRVERRLREWASSENLSPPTKFVSFLNQSWFRYQEVEYKRSKSDWKSSIDFVLEHWHDHFQESVFLRPSHRNDFNVASKGPEVSVRQADEVRLSLDSYNPHLSDEQLVAKRLNVAVSDVLGDVASIPKLERDGELNFSLTFLEPGNGRVVIDVQPDAHLSVYVPISTNVLPNPDVDPAGPRVLGTEWKKFLEGVGKESPAESANALELFTRLSAVFPGDSELMVQRGTLHLNNREFAKAREDFKQPLSRSEPRALWGSLLASLHLEDDQSVSDLLMASTALPSSQENSALFERTVSQFVHLPDSVVEWFCEYPVGIISDDKSLRMLVEMTKGSREEETLLRVFQEMGKLEPKLVIRQTAQTLREHPDWRHLRLLRAQVAKQTNLIQVSDDDAEMLLEYVGQDVSDYLETLEELKPLIHPQRLPTVLFSNAVRLFSCGQSEHVSAAIQIALSAAHLASENGDIAEAQRCLGFLELRLMDDEAQNHRYRDSVNHVSARVTSLLRNSEFLTSVLDHDVEELIEPIRADYQGRPVVVFGGRPTSEKETRLKEVLQLSTLVWIGWQDTTAPDPKKLLEAVKTDSTLVIIAVDDGLIPTSIRQEMHLRKARMSRCLDSVGSVLHSLKFLAQKRDEVKMYIPATCADALQWAQLNCPNLEFSQECGKRVSELDAAQGALRIRQRIIDDLMLLDKYAVDAKSGAVSGGIKVWLQLHGYSPNDFASTESQSTGNDPNLRRARTFKCSPGNVYMPAHLKLSKERPVAPRIHFSVDYVSTLGKVLIGYVGPHLPTSQERH